MTWQQFEKDCFAYICENYTQFRDIKAFGMSDSNKADIEITPYIGAPFFVETKEESAQCGQFVLFPNEDTRTFEFSKGNKTCLTPNCAEIIAVMERDFDRFSKVGTAGIPINVDKTFLYGWVMDVYALKNVKYFITKGDTYMIFPIEKLPQYFDIEAFYRRKTSGSSEPNQRKNSREMLEGFSSEGITGTVEFAVAGGKMRCFLHTEQALDKKRIVCQDHTYQLKYNEYAERMGRVGTYCYEVRRLSNTSNPNVICQLTLKHRTQIAEDLKQFEAET